MAKDASDVGVSGLMNSASCPATSEVFSQSRRIVPVRKRTIPRAEPLGMSGKPPAKSNFTFALVRAPAMSGPNASIPICD